MIFSNPALARFLSNNFECAWKSVRPAARVEIDFGDGRKLTRTLNGNVATWYCDANGRAFDLQPGVVTPSEYARRAAMALALHKRVKTLPNARTWLTSVHAGRLPAPPPVRIDALLSALEHAGQPLRKDTAFNKKHRYPLARKILVEHPFASPRALKNRVYKEVLGTDITDPYLGLAPTVLGGEPGRG